MRNRKPSWSIRCRCYPRSLYCVKSTSTRFLYSNFHDRFSHTRVLRPGLPLCCSVYGDNHTPFRVFLARRCPLLATRIVTFTTHVCVGGGGCTHGIVIPMNESAVSITHTNCKKVFSLSFMVVIVNRNAFKHKFLRTKKLYQFIQLDSFVNKKKFIQLV